jgi:hypothetical protein
MAKSAELAPAHTILLNSGPSQTRIFTNDAKIAKAMEAADKHRPYTPKPTFNRSRGFKPASKMTPYRKPKAAKSPVKKSENPKGPPLHRKRGDRSARD